MLCCRAAAAVTPALRPATEVNTEGKQAASGWEAKGGFEKEEIKETGSTMEEGSEGEESVDELLRKMAEQPADAALQLRGLKAMRVRGGSADPHLAAAAIVAAMQAHPGDAALQLEACRAAFDHFTEKLEESEAEGVQAAVNLMEHGLTAHVQVTIRNHSHDHDLFDAAVLVLFVLYGIVAERRNSHVASEALLRGEDAAIVPLLLARMQDVAEASGARSGGPFYCWAVILLLFRWFRGQAGTSSCRGRAQSALLPGGAAG